MKHRKETDTFTCVTILSEITKIQKLLIKGMTKAEKEFVEDGKRLR